jgi:hypothetical protein
VSRVFSFLCALFSPLEKGGFKIIKEKSSLAFLFPRGKTKKKHQQKGTRWKTVLYRGKVNTKSG